MKTIPTKEVILDQMIEKINNLNEQIKKLESDLKILQKDVNRIKLKMSEDGMSMK